MQSNLHNVCSTCTASLSCGFVFSLLRENELYLPTVCPCLCTGSWGLLKWITLGICKTQHKLANRFLAKESNTLSWIFPSSCWHLMSHMAADLPQAPVFQEYSPILTWTNGHYINPCICDFYIIIEEAVCLTMCLITVPFKRLSHWRMDVVSLPLSAFEEENTNNAL